MSKSAIALRESSLAEHLEAVQTEIRRHPADADMRAQLFQLMAVQGEWTRALEQIKLAAQLNPQAQPSAILYEQVIAGEAQRERVWAGLEPPAGFGHAPGWFEDLALALQRDADAPEQAAALRAQAYEAAPATAGEIGVAVEGVATTFAWISDGDSRLGPVMEFMMGSRYGWLPFAALRNVRILAPEGLADLVWAQAEITTTDGRTHYGAIPARYPALPGQQFSELPDGVKLGRMTDWHCLHEDMYAGIGQKMWMTDQGEYALLDIRTVEMA
ncbi:type VI secretion system accessory protein TagJ [Bordetella sp. 15P40C-2]|uniref:type VI secretion system accessory protein TagJ n=1 Tax=Bordetella sp. 15P40C-2 TaxID=2572246 RepID=UPI001326618D|nr:type VI secretion system accessory protein TagJ [Bordetella sp. 15P40C-2]MVW70268.1 ImpE family protein [Bordetella sp. 15P40C-2]